MFSTHSASSRLQLVRRMPIFDADDMEYFRHEGLALRHVELDLGIREQREGSPKAMPLALRIMATIQILMRMN
jgi:hypothetical protein